MRTRTVRWLGILTLVGGLLGGPPPQARSATLFTAYVVGAVSVGTGLGDMILTLTTTTHVLLGSPRTTVAHLLGGSAPQSTCLPLPNGVGDDPLCLTNSHFVFDHLRSVSVGSVGCIGGGVDLVKQKAPISGPLCSFFSVVTPSLPNTISGHCGLNSGQVTMRFTDGSSGIFAVDAHFFSTLGGSTGAYMLLTGHVTKSQVTGGAQLGLIVGIFDQIPPTPTSGQSCTNKTARDFIYTGVIVIYAI